MTMMACSAQAALRLPGLLVAAEAVAHRGEDLLRKGVRLPRAEARIERRRQHLGRHRLVHRGVDGPAAFAGVLDMARIAVERAVARQRLRGEIEQPGGDDAAAPPDLGDVGDVEVEPVFLGQRLAVGVLQNVEAFGIGLHQTVLDAVVDHLDEVAGAVRPGVDVALFDTRVARSRGRA